jgi:RNA polymerase sigma-70 factor (ECF subfamily)
MLTFKKAVFLVAAVVVGGRGALSVAQGDAVGEPPKIVSTSPAVGTKDVDPATAEITVTFDRDMAKGFSWTGGGTNCPAGVEGQGPFWRDARTAVYPVQLQPGRFYRIGVNSKSRRNFRSAEGVSAQPSVIYFTTKGAGVAVVDKMAKPAVLEMSPANGATGVDPKTAELRVTFSVPMGPGFSWTGGGPSYPPLRAGERPHWTEDRITCILPVRLEPNRQYRLGLNSPSHKNFQSAAGVPLAPVVYTFKTGK